jgi:branched-chain amino acid transport system ATP-binding protein
MDTVDSATNSRLEVDNVTKRFGGLTAVDAVSLEVHRGEIFGLIGPNGAGKTTLFNVIAGAARPDQGRIRFDGADITSLSAASRCERGLTRTFQNPRPFRALTVLQNAMVGGIARGQSVARAHELAATAVRDVGLWDWRDATAAILSLGQQKRLEIARCLATGPRLLLLDEITGGLGPAEVDSLMRFITSLLDRDITIVMIEHNMRVALTSCSRIVVLNFGGVIARGTGEAIAQDPLVIEAYLGNPELSATGAPSSNE